MRSRTLLSINPAHSRWSSGVAALTSRTIKCLYLVKNDGESNSLSQVCFPSMISSVRFRPFLNSSIIIVLVDEDTLNVEFCCGYAGVMIGIRWYRSVMFTCAKFPI